MATGHYWLLSLTPVLLSVLLSAVPRAALFSVSEVEDRFVVHLNEKNTLSSIDVPSILKEFDFRKPEAVEAFRQTLPEFRTPDYVTIFSPERQFACKLPTERIRAEGRRRRTPEIHEIANKVEVGFALFNCIRKRFELWTYELCHGERIRRYVSKGKGREVKAEVLAEGAPLSLSVPPASVAGPRLPFYFEEVYQGKCRRGTDRADETAFVYVQYECDRKVTRVGSYIVDVFEDGPCDMRLRVKMGILCDDYAFRSDKQHLEAMEIVCEPVFDNDELETFIDRMRETQRRQRKNKSRVAFAYRVRRERLTAFQKRRAALWITQKVREEKAYLKTERRLKALWLRELKRYIEAAFIAERGVAATAGDVQTLLAIGTVLDDRDFYIRSYGSDWEDQNRGLFWDYLHERWWPKTEYPLDLNTVDLYNGFDAETVEELVREAGREDPAKLKLLAERWRSIPNALADVSGIIDRFELLMQKGWIGRIKEHEKEAIALFKRLFPVWYPFEKMFDEKTGKPKEFGWGDIAETQRSSLVEWHSSTMRRTFASYVAGYLDNHDPVDYDLLEAFVADRVAPFDAWIEFHRDEFHDDDEEDEKWNFGVFGQRDTLEVMDYKSALVELVYDLKIVYLRQELAWKYRTGQIKRSVHPLNPNWAPVHGRYSEEEKYYIRKIDKLQDELEGTYYGGYYEEIFNLPLAHLGQKVLDYFWRDSKEKLREFGRQTREAMFDGIESTELTATRWEQFENILKDPRMTGRALIERCFDVLRENPRKDENELEELYKRLLKSMKPEDLIQILEDISEKFRKEAIERGEGDQTMRDGHIEEEEEGEE